MFQELGVSLGVRTDRVLGLVSVLWLTSVVSSSDVIQPTNDSFIRPITRAVQLQTSPDLLVKCGEDVTLTCEASSSTRFTIRKMVWSHENSNLCTFKNGTLEPKSSCESKAESPNKRRLDFTITNVMPATQGEYTCKLQSALGLEDNTTSVTLKECRGNASYSKGESHIECRFDGVYPNGTVHWLRGGANLTGSAITQGEEDQNGLFSVNSTLQIQPGKMTESYWCILWTPATGNLSKQEIKPLIKSSSSLSSSPPSSSPPSSSGNIVKMQWISIIAVPIAVKLIT